MIVLFLATSTMANDFGPWSEDPRHPAFTQRLETKKNKVSKQENISPFSSSFLGLAYLFWKNFLTKSDGPRCAHRPSCSRYAHLAIRTHGIPLGIWMAFDRLMRGSFSSTLRSLELIRTSSGVYFLDPLENNEFWKTDYIPMSGR
jgi:putative component of membrane protein insertase Oxa1/YidC/SpoIIIJ protein YidD